MVEKIKYVVSCQVTQYKNHCFLIKNSNKNKATNVKIREIQVTLRSLTKINNPSNEVINRIDTVNFGVFFPSILQKINSIEY